MNKYQEIFIKKRKVVEDMLDDDNFNNVLEIIANGIVSRITKDIENDKISYDIKKDYTRLSIGKFDIINDVTDCRETSNLIFETLSCYYSYYPQLCNAGSLEKQLIINLKTKIIQLLHDKIGCFVHGITIDYDEIYFRHNFTISGISFKIKVIQ